ncbi:hypothetical protein BBK36DRAFT_1176427 [Trichoderma citrinoviride]|uniref:Protein Zds1 C-terminal domain-containing protein n=1 Tax=Trichoderma citrinoviride TaxID=58853 RepID=A0A2T4B5A8_9HYPO|nr:hypothetical protein BBK36DRAFT_1176427 [Trichoderma citrinoviride]PTB64512.1 hypothetical protein BBK36DRAFT_1176427 [Trichoderma citrinoviride]
MTSSRLHGDVAGTLSTRRGHSSQLSISDPSHHVTEAIGNLYDEDEDLNSETSRPLSFVADPAYENQVSQPRQQHNEKPLQSNKASSVSPQSAPDQHTRPKPYNGNGGSKSSPTTLSTGHNQWSDQLEEDTRPVTSPTLSLRGAHAQTSGQQFPLTNIDNPNDIAQELSNLQALRRLSMDVGNSIDPDMPPMSLAAMPAVAPRGDDDENDPSRLLWVPARVHPELAPTEFKTFLASRLQSIRRRSGDSFLSVSDEKYGNEQDPMNSSSLRRKKSLLSRQIDSSDDRAPEGLANGMTDKPERQGFKNDQQDRELSLDELVKDPSKAVQRLAQESHSYSGSLESGMDDIPILAVAPSSGLRRSTRTTYRKGGSLRFGDKASFSKRMAQRHQSGDSIEIPAAGDPPRGYPLIKVQSEPASENFSRPTRPDRRQDSSSQEPSAASTTPDPSSASRSSQFSIRGSSAKPRASTDDILNSDQLGASQDNRHPDKSPQRPPQTKTTAEEPGLDSAADDLGNDTIGRSNHRSLPGNNKVEDSSSVKSSITATTQTGAVPPNSSNGNAHRTDVAVITTAHTRDEKRGDKKARKDKDEDSHNSSRSGSAWKWLKGVADDRDKKKDESKKSRHKAPSEKAQDSVRLDVIQTSLEKTATKGRESLVLDRESLDNKLSDERKKDSHRKSDSKREKDGSLFSSIFGGGKKREEKEKNKKHQQLLHVPEDIVPYKPLQPDVDYNWSRFPLLEERAIYRMAHIKLANPRRSLHSQVLLSNFMYSYLAIVQAMHPQMNVPVSPQQKRLEEEARRKREEQEYLAQREAQDEGDEQDQQQSLEQYDFDYHRTTVQYADSNSDQPVEYVDDAQIYEDDHTHDDHGGYGADDAGGYGQEVKDYYRYHHDVSDRHSSQDGVW